jgi:hypothetical protein
VTQPGMPHIEHTSIWCPTAAVRAVSRRGCHAEAVVSFPPACSITRAPLRDRAACLAEGTPGGTWCCLLPAAVKVVCAESTAAEGHQVGTNETSG